MCWKLKLKIYLVFDNCKWFGDMVIDAAVDEFGHYSNYVFCCNNPSSSTNHLQLSIINLTSFPSAKGASIQGIHCKLTSFVGQNKKKEPLVINLCNTGIEPGTSLSQSTMGNHYTRSAHAGKEIAHMINNLLDHTRKCAFPINSKK